MKSNLPDDRPKAKRREEVEILEVAVPDLKEGMYVCGLDRPWVETPFLMQGFTIDCQDDIRQLAYYCKSVQIDRLKSVAPMEKLDRKMQSMEELFHDRTLTHYAKKATWRDELPEARKSISELASDTSSMMKAIRTDTPFDMNQIRSSVSGVVDSVIRNPDTSMWLTRLKTKDSYLYSHSVSCSIWAVAVGRQIGLPKHDLRTLALGGLLFDIGKVKLPAKLLTKTGNITDEERKLLNRHVEEGVKAVSHVKNLGPDVIDIIRCHHERHDGSGYPRGLVGNQIPILARIIAIVDCYDAMTSERHFAKASSPSIVTRKLYAWRDRMFQAELVEEFIQSVGVYPAGTLVQMSTGEVGIVTAVSKTQRLRPRIIMVLDRDKKPLKEMQMINLAETKKNERGESLNIVKSLEPGAYGIDPRVIGGQK
jgi:HD-GYP domain-containing protein (c-di-GMP phosphodiesterase class II)